MDSMGVWTQLRNMGIQNDDIVIVEGVEMYYTDNYF